MTEFEKMGCTYRQEGDYFLPNLKIGEQDEVLIGVWGQRHRQYLKKHHHVRYYNLLTAGALNSYLTEIELQAQALFNDIVMRLSEEENVTENLKATDPMECNPTPQYAGQTMVSHIITGNSEAEEKEEAKNNSSRGDKSSVRKERGERKNRRQESTGLNQRW